MRVLLLHPDDPIPGAHPGRGWDLVVDLGRAPASTYERWSSQAQARVISLYEFSNDREDLRRIRELLQLGTGRLVDGLGIDWWDVLSLLIEPDLRQLILIGRLARELKSGCELSASRSSAAATALQALTGAKYVRLRLDSIPSDDGRNTIAMFLLSWTRRRSARLFKTNSIVNTRCGGGSLTGAGLPGSRWCCCRPPMSMFRAPLFLTQRCSPVRTFFWSMPETAPG